MKQKIKCPKCKYEWETKSTLKSVTCPSCQLKVKIPRKSDTLKNGKQYEKSKLDD
jgi:predicted RNA-binding Zn-ribbon protein involved in translation (DUF1610 family)